MKAPAVIDRLRARIGVPVPCGEATIEAGSLRRFAEAIGDSNPRWRVEGPPTFLVALVPEFENQLVEAEEYGKGWLNGGNGFEYFEPARVGDRIAVTGKVVDVYEKTGSSGHLLFIIFETEYVNQHGRLVARLRGTTIRR